MDKRNFQIGVLLLAVTFILSGCASGISGQARSQVTYTGPFNAVQDQPENYKDKIVMWGGRIIETITQNGSTEIVVLQMELGSRGYPMESDKSQGRFMIHSQEFMDPAIYSEGALVTVVGKLDGSETRLIGEMSYRYPVISMIEIKKWAPGEDPSPRFHFGIGIGAHF